MQGNAVKAINVSLTVRNWLFGFYIVEYEQNGKDRSEYGAELLSKLSEQLKTTGLKNISIAELSRFRQFYNTYPQILGTLSQLSVPVPKAILGTLSQLSVPVPKAILGTPSQTSTVPSKDQLDGSILIKNLSFSHFSELLKIGSPLKRLFYEVQAIKGTWSVRELRRQINTLLFERTEMSKNANQLIKQVQDRTEISKVEEVLKSPFTFEFLGLKVKDIVLESDLEQALIDNLQNFLLEMGEGFCFEVR